MAILDADGNPISSEKISLKELTFKELPSRLKVFFVVVSAGVAVTATLLSNIETIISLFSKPSANLVLEDTIVSDDGYRPRVELFFRNAGDANAVVTRAQIEITEEIRANGTFGQGIPKRIIPDLPYNVSIPLGDSDKKTVSISDFYREIKPDEVDRVSLVIKHQNLKSSLLIAFTFKIKFKYNNSKELVTDPITVAATYPNALNGRGVYEKVRPQANEILSLLSESKSEKGVDVLNIKHVLSEMVNSQK